MDKERDNGFTRAFKIGEPITIGTHLKNERVKCSYSRPLLQDLVLCRHKSRPNLNLVLNTVIKMTFKAIFKKVSQI